MANGKSALKNPALLQAILDSPDEDEKKVTVSKTDEELRKSLEDHDVGLSDNKSGRGMAWYVAKTTLGYEKKVRDNILKSVENRHLEDKILDVRVPMQEVTEIRSTGKKVVQKKVLPGYVLVHMDVDDNEAWYVVRNTGGVTGFVGPGGKPVPLEESEIEQIEQGKVAKAEFEVGDVIMVIDGAWRDTIGNVTKIDENKQTATIMVEMFGRETPVEINFAQVKKIV